MTSCLEHPQKTWAKIECSKNQIPGVHDQTTNHTVGGILNRSTNSNTWAQICLGRVPYYVCEARRTNRAWLK